MNKKRQKSDRGNSERMTKAMLETNRMVLQREYSKTALTASSIGVERLLSPMATISATLTKIPPSTEKESPHE